MSPRCADQVDIEVMKRELKCDITPVEWISGFYKLPIDVKISQSEYFQKGVDGKRINYERMFIRQDSFTESMLPRE